MTTTEALAKMHGATVDNTYPDGDMTSFGGWNKDEVVAALCVVRACAGEGNAFVADGLLTVVFHGGDMFVSGPHKE